MVGPDEVLISERFDLGRPRGAMTPVHGGLLNRMWRLDTDDGSFAIKELNLQRDWTYRADDVLRLELAAFAAGVPMPEPIPGPSGSAAVELEGASLLAHRWVDGDKILQEPVAETFAHEIGSILARIHQLDVAWDHVSVEDPMPTEASWRALADRAASTRQPWADALADVVPHMGAIGRFVEGVGRPEPIVLTHRDVNQKNLLDRAGQPVLLDWETTGHMPLACELGSTALLLSRGTTLESVQPAVFRAVVHGYRETGGVLPKPGRYWFADHLAGWTWFVAWNIDRCLEGGEPSSGPSLDVAHNTVRDGIRMLPQTFSRLDELAELTAVT